MEIDVQMHNISWRRQRSVCELKAKNANLQDLQSAGAELVIESVAQTEIVNASAWPRSRRCRWRSEKEVEEQQRLFLVEQQLKEEELRLSLIQQQRAKKEVEHIERARQEKEAREAQVWRQRDEQRQREERVTTEEEPQLQRLSKKLAILKAEVNRRGRCEASWRRSGAAKRRSMSRTRRWWRQTIATAPRGSA